jgi:hypothetical protein
MSDAINEAELGRSKKSVSPQDHLKHLLGLGWDPQSPLIQKYVLKNRLQAQMQEWQAATDERTNSNAAPKLKNRKAADR